MIKAFSILFIGVGVLCGLGVFFPRFRAHWKGTRVVCGPIGCAGFGLSFISLGVTRFFSDSLSERHRDWLVWSFLAGWIVAIIGFILDRRRAKRAGMIQNLQRHLITKERPDRAD